MRVKKVDHIAMLVRDMDSLLRVLTDVFGLKINERMEFPEHRIKVVFLGLGELQIEIIQPTGPDTPFTRYLDSRGQGLHHLAVEVEDIEAALKEARESGLKLEDNAPRPGVGGSIAYLDPESTSGVYLQFVEKAKL
jgi:methylmalonyl-CoA epimerase